MPRNPRDIATENCERYDYLNGQLPQFDIENPCGINLDNITYPGVTSFSFREFHFRCPFSTQADFNMMRDMDILSSTYWQMIDVPLDMIISHTNTQGVMIREARGRIRGHLCVDDTCSYYISTGNRYFYR